MTFVKFHNMKQEKFFFLISPLNTKKLFFFSSQIFTLQQVKTLLQSQFTNVQISFFFQLLSIFLKNVRSVLFFSICCVQQCSSFFFYSSLSFFIVLSLFPFIFFIFYNKLLIHYPFFSNLISASLCLYLNRITIGSLPLLFNFNPYFHK